MVLETTVTLGDLTDPASLGAAITTGLCGHWEHEGACRWPHHTEVTDVTGGTAAIRTVVVARGDRDDVERRIRDSLGRGHLPGREGTWSVRGVAMVEPRPDEITLARRIGALRTS